MEDKGVTAVVGVQHSSVMERNLRKIVEELSFKDQHKFEDLDLILEGYENFLKYSTKMRATAVKEKKHVQEEHQIYERWFKVNNENLV